MTYFIVVPELWTRGYYVDANTPGEALEKVEQFEAYTLPNREEVSERESDLESTFDIGTWSVAVADTWQVVTKEAQEQYNVIPHTEPHSHPTI